MIALSLTTLLLAGNPTNVESAPTSSEPAEAPIRAVWIQPVSLVGTATIATVTRNHLLVGSIPLGANFEIGDTEVAVELSFLFGDSSFIAGASFGPTLHRHTGTWRDGFFIQPKVRFDGGIRQGLPDIEAKIALDIGYQFRAGGLYAAFALGGGLGYGLSNQNLDGMLSLLLPGFATATSHAIGTVNLNLFRLGYAF
jgi:hypothetical protein